ncbi:lipid-A-disaccharide synthase [Rickettsiales endosymbiont of Peranema trichophorum]|uniref:lipid-A-disaccharide synthase n=1 Tax=Rickettsiales endosymbiont of Peranema trichophorum TaxID=2486577 RepID=UPI0010237099|nr:lipid-A-disaccharide synthase [Rickettsiales endosymbiont of Peranema trichophorum]RZI47470.1 lipid-A-disaccharide synthase [Rickettsiales endosymbiont of Peranema trichophorum]
MTSTNNFKFCILAGEASGDKIGAHLIRWMKVIDSRATFYGVGGSAMLNAGLPRSMFPIEDISIMGLVELIPHIFRIKRLIKETADEILRIEPAVVVTIDAPGFNRRVIENIRSKVKSSMKIVNYVAPSPWALNEHRLNKVMKRLATLYDHQFLILPNEEKYCDAVALPATFVGHPICEMPLFQQDSDKSSTIRAKYGIHDDEQVIVLMPGSRKVEIMWHKKIYMDVMAQLIRKAPNLKFFMPTLPHIEDMLHTEFATLGNRLIISSSDQTRCDLLSIASFGIIKSGTSSVELMYYGIPMIVVYRVSSLTACFLRRMLDNKYFAICNIVMNQQIVEEFIQERCQPNLIANKALDVLNDVKQQDYQKKMYRIALDILGRSLGEPPGLIAAKKLEALVSERV